MKIYRLLSSKFSNKLPNKFTYHSFMVALFLAIGVTAISATAIILTAFASASGDGVYDATANYTAAAVRSKKHEILAPQPKRLAHFSASLSPGFLLTNMAMPIPTPPMPPPPVVVEIVIPEPTEPTEPTEPELPYIIALTFDDGPSRYTIDIMDIMYEHNAQATFFVLGNRIAGREDILRRAVGEGHEVAGHSWNHRNFGILNAHNVALQIQDTSYAIRQATGRSPSIYRPPYGIVNNNVRNVSHQLGYKIVNWSIDPEDWRNRDADYIFNHIMDRAVHGGIVLLHDIRPYTRDAVEMLVPALIERGFRLVTTSELLTYVYGELEAGQVYTGVRP